jgi:trans-aconitate methyltransferase
MPEVKWNADLYNRQHSFVYHYGEELINWLSPAEGEKIIDIGCGTGELTDRIFHSGVSVTGIDASVEMIAKARQNFPAIGFEVKDATNFEMVEKFDAAFSNATLHWINDQAAALKNIANCLKPGGRFVFEMGGKHNIESIHHALGQALKQAGFAVPSQSNYFPSVGQQATLLEQSGFSVSDVKYFQRPTKLEGESGMELWINQFCGFFFRQMPAEQKAAVTRETVNTLRKTNYTNGAWYADYVRLRVKAIRE